MADITESLKDLLPNLQKQVQGNVPSGSNSGDVSQAIDILNMQYQPQVTTVGSSIQQLQRLLEQDTAAQQKYGQIADQKITEIGDQLSKNLGLGVKATQDIFGNAVTKVGQSYQNADQSMADLTKGTTEGLSNFAQRLGQSQALSGYGNPIDRLNAQAAANRTQAQESGAAAQTNLQTLGSTLAGIAQQRVGSSQQEYAGKRAEVAKMVAGNIAELQQRTGQGIQELLDNLTDIASTYGSAFRTTLQGITQARTEAEREAANDQLANMLKQVQIEKGYQDLEQGNLSMALNTQRYNQEAEMNPLDLLSKQLGIQGQELSNQKSVQDLLGTGQEMKGNTGLERFIQDTGQRGYFRGAVTRILNQAGANAADLGSDPYKEALKLINEFRAGNTIQFDSPEGYKGPVKNYQFPLNDVLRAIDIYYKGSGR